MTEIEDKPRKRKNKIKSRKKIGHSDGQNVRRESNRLT